MAVRVNDGVRDWVGVRDDVGVCVDEGVNVSEGVNVNVGVDVSEGVNVNDGIDVSEGVNVNDGTRLGVAVTAPTWAAATAARALAIPLPQRLVVHGTEPLSAGKAVTLPCMRAKIWLTDALGSTPYNKAARPAACGVAMLVPCMLV